MRRAQQPQHEVYNEHHVVVFDLETIVDDEPVDGSFPPWPRHRVVAGSFLTARWTPIGYEFRLDTMLCRPGEEEAFYKRVDELLPAGATGISYNGRGFDNRVLALQGMRWCPSLNLPGIARQASAGRYEGAHCDLADVLAGQGSTRSVSLVELCAAIDIPAKIDTSGAAVGDLWRAGEYQKILDYVDQDVAGTYLLWLHWIAFQKGDEKLLSLPLAELAAWIESNPILAHLKPFVECRPARLARARAPALRAQAALADAERRIALDRDEAAFAMSEGSPF